MSEISQERIYAFEQQLYLEEKSRSTVKKYVLAIRRLAEYLEGEELSKQRLLQYREKLLGTKKAQTVNGILSAINAFLDFCSCSEMKVKFLKVQKQTFIDEGRELTREEYERLLAAARQSGRKRIYMLMLTLGSTGIQISELQYITVQAAKAGRTEIRLKGKIRSVVFPKKLCRRLLKYAAAAGIEEGCIFQTKNGNIPDRSNIWRELKQFCMTAGVNPTKVFPHNFRRLFARAFYAVEKNLAHLADVLGHSRIETTRIYVAVSAASHERILTRMGLIL